MIEDVRILYEDNHLLVVNKPPLLPTMGVRPGEESLVEIAKEYLKEKYSKPGNVYLGVVSRLDAFVSGVVLFARTSKAAARLNRQFQRRSVSKGYCAVIRGKLPRSSGQLVNWLIKDEQRQRMAVVGPGHAGSKEACLTYRLLGEWEHHQMLQIDLETGRKHQIRVQFAHAGFPILGDRKYGSRQAFGPGIALHAFRLAIDHPVSRDRIEWVAPPPASWRQFPIRPR